MPKLNLAQQKTSWHPTVFLLSIRSYLSVVQEKITITCKLTNYIITANQIEQMPSLMSTKVQLQPAHSRNLTLSNHFSLHFKFRVFITYIWAFSSSNIQNSLAFLPHRYIKFCEKVVASDFYGQSRLHRKHRKRHKVFFLLLGKYINDMILWSCAYNFNMFGS